MYGQPKAAHIGGSSAISRAAVRRTPRRAASWNAERQLRMAVEGFPRTPTAVCCGWQETRAAGYWLFLRIPHEGVIMTRSQDRALDIAEYTIGGPVFFIVAAALLSSWLSADRHLIDRGCTDRIRSPSD